MRYIFIVQGEGRGHMTQAIALSDLLISAGHEICHVFIGKSERRKIPSFFHQRILCPITELASPNFVTDLQNKRVKVIPSVFYNLKYYQKYFSSMAAIDKAVKEKKPGVIINFYDILGGLYFGYYRPRAKIVALGHQFLTGHPEFQFAPGMLDRNLFITNNQLTSIRADLHLALSFMPYLPDRYKKTVVTPPLLRKEVFELKPTKGDYILAYMVNDGYAQEIMEWHLQHREIKVHCFWDRKDEPEILQVHENLHFHQLNAEKYLDYMSKCSGLITTAGFESVCEAMYLGKPVMMIPVAGQYEQSCNAIDAEKAGAGISDQRFNISRLLDFIPVYQDISATFKQWVDQSKAIILKELTSK